MWVRSPKLVSSLAMEASRLVSDSPAWKSKPSAASRKTPTASGSSNNGSQTDTWTTLPFGTTSQPSTGDLGVDTWILLLAVSRASRTAQPGSGEELLTNAISGPTPLESFGTWDPATSCWRTFQASLLTGTAEPWSGSWPKSGMTVSGISYLRRPLVPRTSVGVGGAWPTPDANRSSYAGEGHGPNLREQVAVQEGQRLWPTPKAHEHMDRNVRGNLTLNGMAKMWPTPKGSPEHYGRPRDNDRGDLQAAAMTFPTPRASMHDMGTMDMSRRSGTDRKNKMVGQYDPTNGGQLNPRWVEWLMGLPIGWVSSVPLATGSYQRWLQSFSRGSADVS